MSPRGLDDRSAAGFLPYPDGELLLLLCYLLMALLEPANLLLDYPGTIPEGLCVSRVVALLPAYLALESALSRRPESPLLD